MDVTAQVRDALDRLGTDPDTVADTLAAKGHVGCRSNVGGNCPIHRYLADQFPGLVVVAVGPSDAYLTEPPPPPEVSGGVRRSWQIDLPAPVRRFVARFDGGHFDQLASEASA